MAGGGYGDGGSDERTRAEGVEPLFDALLVRPDAAAGGSAWDPDGESATSTAGAAATGAAHGGAPLGSDQHLDPRHVTVERIGLAILTAALSGGSLVGLLVAALTTEPAALWLAVLAGAWLVLTGLLALAIARWPEVAHRHTTYRVDADGIEIRRGVWWRSIASVPRSRVQHIDVTQGPLDRRYGLGTLVLHTAGHEYAQVEVEGLDFAVALALRDHLLPRGGDDAV
jgi:membrane protein YdbS with pleckstrin-like domain